jgi:hypothetical protein
MKKKFLLGIVASCFSLGAYSQNFIPTAERFSGKKIAYINLEDGTKVEGTIDDLDRKKGLVEEITIKPTGSKKKKTYEAEKIKSMYLPITGIDNLANRIDQATDINKYSSMGVNMELINKGYALLEKTNVRVKRKTQALLVQLLNPAFCTKIKVYTDPYAGETAGFGVGGLKLTGGDDKSYYVQIGDAVAERMKKKEYDEEYTKLYQGCPALIAKVKEKLKWSDFDKHVYEYTTECK